MPGYGKRADGSEKGSGYFGEIKSSKGDGFSTELGMNVSIGGKDVHFPLINPNLTGDEIQYLVDGGRPTRDMVDRSIDWAMQRLDSGKSPFAAPDETLPFPKTRDELMKEGYDSAKGSE